MPRFAQLLSDGDFASGVTPYDDHFPGDEGERQRLVIYVQVGEMLTPTPCIVDTGAAWCVINPSLVQPLINTGRADIVEGIGYQIRGTRYEGLLVRLDLAFQDELSNNRMVIDATVFVPELRHDQEWREPNFIGLKGCLERIRFAVDPAESRFYFGRA